MSPHTTQGLAGARRSVIGDSPQLLTHYYDDARTMYEVFRRGFSISGESTVVRRPGSRRWERWGPCYADVLTPWSVVSSQSSQTLERCHFPLQKAMMTLPCFIITISVSPVYGVLPHRIQRHGQIIIFDTIKDPSGMAHILPCKTGVNKGLGRYLEEWISTNGTISKLFKDFKFSSGHALLSVVTFL